MHTNANELQIIIPEIAGKHTGTVNVYGSLIQIPKIF